MGWAQESLHRVEDSPFKWKMSLRVRRKWRAAGRVALGKEPLLVIPCVKMDFWCASEKHAEKCSLKLTSPNDGE